MRFSGRPSFFNVTDNAVADAAEFTFLAVSRRERPTARQRVCGCLRDRAIDRERWSIRARARVVVVVIAAAAAAVVASRPVYT